MATKRLIPLTTLLRSSAPRIHRHLLPHPRPTSISPSHRHTPITIPHRLQSTTTPPQATPKSYTFPEIHSLTTSPSATRLLIDVREPSELQSTGRIPGAVSMPISSHPDAIYLPADEFYDRFGFEKPGSPSSSSSSDEIEGFVEEDAESSGAADLNPSVTVTAGHGGADPSADLGEGNYGGEGGGVQEVVFYCKAGVRSRAAARMAVGEGGWRGVKVGEMGGGWDEWSARGGEVER